jgi:hypothetical protein
MPELQLIATVALMVSAQSVFAGSGSAPAPSVKPVAANAKDEKTLVSVSGMTAPEYAQCVSDLTSSHVVFQQAGDVSEQGCKLSGAIRLKAAVACRARYDKPGAFPSEHAKGNAVDIAAFVLGPVDIRHARQID